MLELQHPRLLNGSRALVRLFESRANVSNCVAEFAGQLIRYDLLVGIECSTGVTVSKSSARVHIKRAQLIVLLALNSISG